MNLSNLRLGTRLGASFAILLMFMAAIAVVGVRGVGTLHDSLKTVYEDRVLPLQQLAEINALMLRNRQLVSDMLANPAADSVARHDAELTANIAAIASAVPATSGLPIQELKGCVALVPST